MGVNKVEVLFDGFSHLLGSVMSANCTCTLVQTDQMKILIDTMTCWDGEKLLAALEERNISKDDIDYVIGTHGHSDHIGNMNLFLKAKHIVGTSMNQHETYFDVLQNGSSYNICEGVTVVPTPGHTASCVSVIVSGTDKGTIVVAGDLFEKREDLENSSIWEHLAGSENPLMQAKNRQKVLNMADYIIPGHGGMFQVTPDMRRKHDMHLRQMRKDYSSPANGDNREEDAEEKLSG